MAITRNGNAGRGRGNGRNNEERNRDLVLRSGRADSPPLVNYGRGRGNGGIDPQQNLEIGRVEPPYGRGQGQGSVSVHTARSERSTVIIRNLEEVVRAGQEQLRIRDEQMQRRDEEMAEMRAVLLAAGLMIGGAGPVNVGIEDQAESRRGSTVHEPVRVVAAPIVAVPAAAAPVAAGRGGSSFKDFKNCQPPNFKGEDDPLVCIRWLEKMEQIFDSVSCTETQKVDFAVMMLVDGAMDWWGTITRGMTPVLRRQLTWERFVEKLQERFCNEGAKQRNVKEFLTLQKGGKSITEYNNAFTEKLRFARHICPTEREVVIRYVEGLPVEYKSVVRLQATLEAAMEEARKMEDDWKGEGKLDKAGEKRKWEGPSDVVNKKGDASKKEKQEGKAKYCKTCFSEHQGPCSKYTVKCRNCGKLGHMGKDCRSKDMICYNCKETGHISTQCTKPRVVRDVEKGIEIPKAKARAYHMGAEEADDGAYAHIGRN